MPSLYVVSVFEEILDEDEMDTPLLPELIGLDHVAERQVFASSERQAAARVWCRTVGRARARYLSSLNAPASIIVLQTRVRSVAASLEQCRTRTWAGTLTWKLSNECQTWPLKVEQLPLHAADRRRLRASRRRQRRRRSRLLRAGRAPSAN